MMSSATMGLGFVQDNGGKSSQSEVYLIFAREVGPLIKAKYPNVQKVQFNQILGRIWSELPATERNKYYIKAGQQKTAGPVPPPGGLGETHIQMKPLEPVGGLPVMRRLKPILKVPSGADKDKYPTFQCYYKEIRPQLKQHYPLVDEQELVKKGFQLFKEMHRSETRSSLGLGFEEFSVKTKQNLIKKYPNLSLNEIGQLVEKMWKQMTPSAKEKYFPAAGRVARVVAATAASPAESRSEKTENILMREDDNLQQEGGLGVTITEQEEDQPSEVDTSESEMMCEKTDSDTDPLFIKCESQSAQCPPELTQQAGCIAGEVEEEDVDDPDEDCGENVASPPGPKLSPKNKVPPVTQPRFVKYQKVDNQLRKKVVPDEGKCTTCKILVEEVKRRGDIITKLEKTIEMLGRKEVSTVKVSEDHENSQGL